MMLPRMSPEEYKLRESIYQILRVEHPSIALPHLSKTAKMLGDFVMEYDRFRDEQIKILRARLLDWSMRHPDHSDILDRIKKGPDA